MKISNYLSVTTQEELNQKYQNEDCIIIGGGTNLLVKGIGKNVYQNMTFLPTSEIVELRKIEKRQNQIIIGAAVTLTELLKENNIKEELPLLFKAVSKIASCQIRNRATLVGNIANGCPAADGIQALMVLDAQLEISGCNGIRYMKIADLYKDCPACLKHDGMQVSSCFYPYPNRKKINLGKEEWISRVIVDVQPQQDKSVFYKLTDNQSSNLAIVNIAMTIHKKEELYQVKCAIGGVFSKPKVFIWEGTILEIQEIIKLDLEKEMSFVNNVLIDFKYKRQVVLEKVKELLSEM